METETKKFIKSMGHRFLDNKQFKYATPQLS